MRTNVLVVGGGGAGLAAATAAAMRGASVVLVEKCDSFGGNSARSIGSVPGAGSRLQERAGVDDNPEKFVDDVNAHTSGAVNHTGLKRMAEISAAVVHWLIDEVGVPLRLTEDYRHVGHTVTRLHNPPGREGATIVEALASRARHLGATLRTGVAVTDVQYNATGGSYRARLSDGGVVDASAVVLATDGFGANAEMMQRECAPYAHLRYIGGEGNTGFGIDIGRALGGRTESMTTVLGYAAMGIPDEAPSTWDTMVSWTVIENGGIIVNGEGRRFGDESCGYSAFVDDALADGSATVYVVFDQSILDSVAKWEDRFRRLVDRPDSPIRPLSLDRQVPFGIDNAALAATLETYNATASGGGADEFGRRDTGWAPLQGQLYIARAEPAVLTTLGGLVVGDNAEVLDTYNRPISGVFAAGGTACSIVGTTGAQGYISGAGLLAALGYGMLAGQTASIPD